MKSNFKNFKVENFKKKFRKNSVLYICNIKTGNNFINDMQYYQNFNFDCHKISNIIAKKCLENSSYINYVALFSGLTALTKFNNHAGITKNIKELNKKHILLGLNVNNKIYMFDKKLVKNLLLNFDKDYKKFLTNFLSNFRFFKNVSK